MGKIIGFVVGILFIFNTFTFAKDFTITIPDEKLQLVEEAFEKIVGIPSNVDREEWKKIAIEEKIKIYLKKVIKKILIRYKYRQLKEQLRQNLQDDTNISVK